MIEISTYNANEIVEVNRTDVDEVADILVDENAILYIPAISPSSGGETGYAYQS